MAFELKIEHDDLEVLLGRLELARKKALPFAVRDGLNNGAVLGQRMWRDLQKRTLTVRNTWTERGTIVDKTRSLDIDRMEAVLGSIRPYMGTLEEGGTEHDAAGKPIHTSVASGEGRGARPRARVVLPRNRLNRIKRYKGRKGTKRQRNAAAIAEALAKGRSNKVVYLETQKRKGLFRITGSKRKGVDRVDMIIDLSRKATTVRPHPTLQPTLTDLGPKLPTIYALALIAQLRRWGVIE